MVKDVWVGPEPDPSPWLFITEEMRRIDMARPYDGKTACWTPDEKECYIQGNIVGQKGNIITVKNERGETKDFKEDQVTQVNPPKYEKCEDMSNLTYLNDPSVLHTLKQRYLAELIYVRETNLKGASHFKIC